MKKALLCLLLLLLLCCSCTNSSDISVPPEASQGAMSQPDTASVADSSADASNPQSASEPAESSLAEESISDASGTETDEPVTFPYLPESFNLEEVYPTMYHYDGNFDNSRNNRELSGLSFYLDEAMFVAQPPKHENFLVFDSVPESAVGPYRISLLAEPVTSLYFFVENPDGTLNQVMTLNTHLNDFLKNNPGKTFTYFSETVGDRYIPAAIFQTDSAVGFILYFASEETMYSMQLLSYDSSYADQQKQVMADLVNSFVFSEA